MFPRVPDANPEARGSELIVSVITPPVSLAAVVVRGANVEV
jgi:hypothetical protein